MSKSKSLAVESICYRMGMMHGHWAVRDAHDPDANRDSGKPSFYRRMIEDDQAALEKVVKTARESCSDFDQEQIDKNARSSYVRGMRAGARVEDSHLK